MFKNKTAKFSGMRCRECNKIAVNKYRLKDDKKIKLKLAAIKWRDKNKDKIKLQNKKNHSKRMSQPKIEKERSRSKNKKAVINLSDCYVRRQLIQSKGFNNELIKNNLALIELKRASMKIRRLMRQNA